MQHLQKTGGGTSLKPKVFTSSPPYFITSRRLLPPRRYPDGVIHIGVGFLARFALALITMFKVLKILLKDSRANLAQAFLVGFVQCGLCRMLGTFVWMCTELLDGVKGAPISPVLPLALSRDLFVQGVNQEVIGPQDEREARDPKNHEPLEHAAEPTASPKFILADYSLRQAARGKALISVRAEIHSQKVAEERWSHALRKEREIRKWKVAKREERIPPQLDFSFLDSRRQMSRPRGQGNTCPFPGLPASFLRRSRVVN